MRKACFPLLRGLRVSTRADWEGVLLIVYILQRLSKPIRPDRAGRYGSNASQSVTVQKFDVQLPLARCARSRAPAKNKEHVILQKTNLLERFVVVVFLFTQPPCDITARRPVARSPGCLTPPWPSPSPVPKCKNDPTPGVTIERGRKISLRNPIETLGSVVSPPI